VTKNAGPKGSRFLLENLVRKLLSWCRTVQSFDSLILELFTRDESSFRPVCFIIRKPPWLHDGPAAVAETRVRKSGFERGSCRTFIEDRSF
jgi:hypothetical protein